MQAHRQVTAQFARIAEYLACGAGRQGPGLQADHSGRADAPNCSSLLRAVAAFAL
jgi:hypothetical protein